MNNYSFVLNVSNRGYDYYILNIKILLKDMKAIILIGGLGTRLEPLTITTPKTMVPVLNKPFLEYLILRLKQFGIKSIVLSAGHLAGGIPEYFGDGKRWGVDLHYVLEDRPLGTGGAIKNAEEFLDDTFLVVNGDVFTDINISTMEEFHKGSGALATIALTPVDDPTRYGVIETDENGRVKNFLEKPSAEEVTTNMINAGLIIMEPHLLSLIPPDVKYSYERELFPEILADDKPIYAFAADDYWIDIGTPEKYFDLNADLIFGRSKQYKHPAPGTVLLGAKTKIGEGVNLQGTVIIGHNADIGQGAMIENSLIWDDVIIGEGSVIKNSIIANGCHIGRSSKIEKAVIGSRVRINECVVLNPGSRIYPESVI